MSKQEREEPEGRVKHDRVTRKAALGQLTGKKKHFTVGFKLCYFSSMECGELFLSPPLATSHRQSMEVLLLVGLQEAGKMATAHSAKRASHSTSTQVDDAQLAW